MEVLSSFVLPDNSKKPNNDKVRFIQKRRKTAKISANTRNLIFCPISAEKHGTILMFWSFFFPNQIPTFSREAKSDKPGRLYKIGWNSSRPFQSQKLTGMTTFGSFGRHTHSSLYLQERSAKISQKRKARMEQMPWGHRKESKPASLRAKARASPSMLWHCLCRQKEYWPAQEDLFHSELT